MHVTPADIERDTEYWFEDGNIVLIARGGMGFRVYKGLLARVSPFFKDLFSIPQPDGENSVDNCPVVCLPDDNPEDLRQLLTLIINPRFE